MYNFNFDVANGGVHTLRLSASRLTFNHACATVLKNPQFVLIGLDKEKKLLALKAASNHSKAQCFEFCASGKKTIAIKGFALLKEVKKVFGEAIPRLGKKIVGTFVENEDLLIFELV